MQQMLINSKQHFISNDSVFEKRGIKFPHTRAKISKINNHGGQWDAIPMTQILPIGEN